jgi:hypothetical protein
LSLSGTVTAIVGLGPLPVANAAVTIVDGPSQSTSRFTDQNGRYTFAGLAAGTYQVSASLSGSTTQMRSVNLTNTNATLSFDLLPNRSASFAAVDVLTFDLQSDGTFLAHGKAVPTGDACADNISGVTTIFDGSNKPMASMPWTYPGLVTPLGLFFSYAPCCATSEQVAAYRNGGRYETTFTFRNVYGGTGPGC